MPDSKKVIVAMGFGFVVGYYIGGWLLGLFMVSQILTAAAAYTQGFQRGQRQQTPAAPPPVPHRESPPMTRPPRPRVTPRRPVENTEGEKAVLGTVDMDW